MSLSTCKLVSHSFLVLFSFLFLCIRLCLGTALKDLLTSDASIVLLDVVYESI